MSGTRLLSAGALSAELERGTLRYLRLGGVELIRGIAFLVRGRTWATFEPEISELEVAAQADRFRVSYRATVRDGAARLDYAATIEGAADGSLSFHCRAEAATDFETCRTGFVVLHPADAAGGAVTIEHADGSLRESAFPRLIDPWQPMLNLRALTHMVAPGLRVTCRMEGDVFEMEDQRNWTDASFKTYVRPLALPWPYTLAVGSVTEQAVRVSVAGTPRAMPRDDSETVRIALGEPIGTMPAIGLGCTPEEARAALPHAQRLEKAGAAALVCRYDIGQGHGAADLAAFRDLAEAAYMTVELQIVVHSVSDYADELAAAAAAIAAARLAPEAIAVSPAPDLKSVPPGQPWPDCAPLADLYRAARAAFPGVRLGGGMFSHFTELNRKRPPADLLDFVTFSTTPIVHAADDRSVMESLQALPAMAASARAIAGATRFVVGPSAIGMRDNPYGPAPLDNPLRARLPMAGRDPRQGTRFNAAWTLGYIARFAQGGAARIAVSAPVGAFGIMDAYAMLPVFVVVRGCAELRGATLLATTTARPDAVLALAATARDEVTLWLANLTDRSQTVTLPEALLGGTVRWLDAASASPVLAVGSMEMAPEERADSDIALEAYSVAVCRAVAD